MIRVLRWWFPFTVLLAVAPYRADAQVAQFLPEIDVYTGITHSTYFWFQAKETREDGAPTQAEIGPSFNFFAKPLVKLRNATVFDLDESKKRLWVLSGGYRYLPSPGHPTENRILLMATSNVPLKWKVLVSDRNRLEVNFLGGDATWRYRNRLTLQKTIAIASSYHPSLNASVEAFYNSRFGKWSDTAIYAGGIFPIGKRVQLEPYYEHQNNTGSSSNRQTNALGVILNLFFYRT